MAINPLAHPRKPKISLRCSYSGAPGMGWSAGVDLRTTINGFEVRQSAGEDHRAIVLKSDAPPWRALASLLANQDDEWGIADEALSEVVVSGVSGWQADLLALTWARFGDHDVRLGSIASAMPDQWLDDLASQFRRFVPAYGEPTNFVEFLLELQFQLDLANPLLPQIENLIAQRGCSEAPSPILCLAAALRDS